MYTCFHVVVMSAQDKEWFIEYYCKLSKYTEADPSDSKPHSSSSTSLSLVPCNKDILHGECRRWCAYNFPVRIVLLLVPAYL